MEALSPVRIKTMEYLLVLNPPKEIADHIKRLKELVAQDLGRYLSRYSEPHISLFTFLSNEAQIERLIRVLSLTATQRAPFHIHLKGFDFFPIPGKGVAYVKVQEEDAVRKLNQWLRGHLMKWGKVPKSKIANSDKAHMTIARGLTDEQLELARKVLKGKSLETTFPVEKVTILQRKGPKSRYEPCYELKLGK